MEGESAYKSWLENYGRIGYSLRMKNVVDKVKGFIKKYQMLGPGDRVIAGISGGADSVCLFFVLLELQKEMQFSLIAVHVNHGLRGAEADADEQFVEALCRKYEVPLEIFRVDLESIAKKRKQSLEEAGREVRREVFVQTMEKYKGNRIALAHHQNDNAETLLWNLARGTGYHGLCGIWPVNGWWIRPLLCLNRQEIELCLEKLQQAYCTDLTNLETTYTRNKLRHQVIPILENEVNSQAVRHMNETMEQMCELQEFVGQATKIAFQSCVEEVGTTDEAGYYAGEEDAVLMTGGQKMKTAGYKIAAAEWLRLPAFLQKEVIYSCLERLSGSRRDLGRVHVAAAAELFDRQVGKERNLPGGIRAVRTYDGVLLGKNRQATEEETEQRQKRTAPKRDANATENQLFPGRKVQIPGITVVPEMKLKITAQIVEKEDELKVSEIPQKKYTKWFDYDIMKCLYIRTRQSGDSIVIDKEGHSQKLKSWFVNEKIPAEERLRIPLLADGQQVVWIIGHRMSSAYQVAEGTKQILQIVVEPM